MENVEIDGLKTLRSGLLFLIIGPFLIFIVVVSQLTLILTSSNGRSILPTAIPFLASLFIIIIAGVVLYFIGVIRLREGFKILKSSGAELDISHITSMLLFIGFVTLLIGDVTSIIINVVSPKIVIIGIIPLLVAYIITMIGQVPLGIEIYKTGNFYYNRTTRVGGILFAIPIGIISFIGAVLAYKGLNEITNMLQSIYTSSWNNPITATQQPNASQLFRQVGKGVIKSNGFAEAVIYASTQGAIVSATIIGFSYNAIYINPFILKPGNNQLVFYFGSISGLIKEKTHLIELKIDVKGTIYTFNVAVEYQG